MSTKALKKELMAAVVMLLVAAIALSGSTFAWFAKNNSVKAEDLTLSVKSDLSFLLIETGYDKTAAQVQTANKTTVAGVAAGALWPVAHETISTKGGAEVDGVWYYMYSDSVSDSTGNTSTKTTLAAVSMGAYVLDDAYSLTVAKGSKPIKNIKCTATIQEMTSSAIRVLVVTDTDAWTLDKTTTVSGVLSSSNLTENDVIHVAVYVYYLGSETDITTNNIPNIGGTNITLSFEGELVDK